jgi:hypothetical protein
LQQRQGQPQGGVDLLPLDPQTPVNLVLRAALDGQDHDLPLDFGQPLQHQAKVHLRLKLPQPRLEPAQALTRPALDAGLVGTAQERPAVADILNHEPRRQGDRAAGLPCLAEAVHEQEDRVVGHLLLLTPGAEHLPEEGSQAKGERGEVVLPGLALAANGDESHYGCPSCLLWFVLLDGGEKAREARSLASLWVKQQSGWMGRGEEDRGEADRGVKGHP